MVTIGFPPDYVGGTETYVLGLIEALKMKGHTCDVAYLESCKPEECSDIQVSRKDYQDTHVHVVRVNQEKNQLQWLHFNPELRERLIEKFLLIAKESSPDLIHFHPLQLGFESHLMESLKEHGYKVFLTYHSTTTSCMRSDLVYMGRETCDGQVIRTRCISCVLHSKGVPAGMARLLAIIPTPIYGWGYELMGRFKSLRKIKSFCSIPLTYQKRVESWKRATRCASRIVAVCQWVKDVIVKNDVPADKVVLSRHGLRLNPNAKRTRTRIQSASNVIRFGYLGRVSPQKGILTLVAALRKIPAVLDYRFEFCSSTFSKPLILEDEQRTVELVRKLCSEDLRVTIREQASDDELMDVLASWDALIVPSFWLESGPMVVYEAFSVQTPIIGSRRGGIAELVVDEETGFLFEPANQNQLAELLIRFIRNPEKLRALRKNIPPPRTFEEVASDTLKIYEFQGKL
jgi:glycosyltransferase involved in cell wall biosynthesis